ncbi:hypothetical protein PIB30_047739 [Stylosanthes scabra]|uniref:Cytochrome b561 and DOMON domain-containing protein n=1 Tax=Stylosanthes scabra TaxID=79078 RepID=A0ABU6XHR2_9FABA|nr:hypothetical protein [Stylosanthes scabra]
MSSSTTTLPLLITVLVLAFLSIVAFGDPNHDSIDPRSFCSDDFVDQLETRKFNISGCKKLRTLGAEFAWNYSNLTTTKNNSTTVNGTLIEIMFRAKLSNYEGWVAWGVNPGKKPQMVGTKAIIAIKHSRGMTDVHTYDVTKETRKGCRLWPTEGSGFGLIVLDKQAWSNNTKRCTTLYAKLILPYPEYNITRLNHVWQVGDQIHDDQPLQHRVTLQNVDSTETINITTPDGQSFGENRSFLRSMHGVLNMIGWGTLLPIGVIIARYFRVYPFIWDPTWFRLHIGFQLTGFLIGTAGWAIGLSLGRSSKYYTFHTHRTFGILIFTFSTIQMLAFRLKPKVSDDYRKYWNMYHHFLGYGLLAIIVINIFKGISMLKGGVGWKYAYIGIIALLGAITLTFEILTWIRFIFDFQAISIPPKEDKTNNNSTQQNK